MKLILICLSLFVLFSCQKTKKDTRDFEVDPVAQQDSFYIKALFSGTDMNWIVPSHKNDPAFTYHAGGALGYSDFSNQCLEGNCYYLTAFTQIFRNVPDVRPQINIGFNMASPYKTREEVLSWFTPGAKTYQTRPRTHATADLLDPFRNGIVIYYIDQNGKGWCTNLGDQQESKFESVSVVDEKRKDLSTEKVWKARFSCKLYDEVGNSIQIKDGEIYGPLFLRF